tara:strand:- start:458 stop:718 length:261 start_codon:yes stop_codon:yes gene_type:complete
MKLFIYKTLFVVLCLYILFEFTINAQIRKFESKIENLTSKETLYLIEKKIREEMKSAVNKDKILSDEDATLLRKFFLKISNEIENK